MQLSRRALVKTGLVTGGAAAMTAAITIDTRPSAAATLPKTNPFKLGVASGDPWPSGVVLWTRLAVSPLAVNGLGGMSSSTYTLAWQVATDTKFTKVVRSGTVAAKYASAHSVHVDVTGLLPGRVYYYRFRLGSYYSRVGRTRTAPAFDAVTGSLAMAFVSCSHYEYGYFTAYRRLAEDQPDLVLHLGDYQYEYKGAGPASATSRNHAGPETVTLANYRQRLAQYHTDPDLQAAHAVAPWLVVFDDHEVDNNWADETPENAARDAGVHDPARRGVQGLLREHAAAEGVDPGRSGHEDLPSAAVGQAGELPHARHPAVPRRPGVRERVTSSRTAPRTTTRRGR